jgi:hypothetical protein
MMVSDARPGSSASTVRVSSASELRRPALRSSCAGWRHATTTASAPTMAIRMVDAARRNTSRARRRPTHASVIASDSPIAESATSNAIDGNASSPRAKVAS